jgi:hypothetical protein
MGDGSPVTDPAWRIVALVGAVIGSICGLWDGRRWRWDLGNVMGGATIGAIVGWAAQACARA